MPLAPRNPVADAAAPIVEADAPREAAPLMPANGPLTFRKHTIDKPGGTLFGQASLVDIDKDGDLRFLSQERARATSTGSSTTAPTSGCGI